MIAPLSDGSLVHVKSCSWEQSVVISSGFGFSTYDPANDPDRSVDRDDSSSTHPLDSFVDKYM